MWTERILLSLEPGAVHAVRLRGPRPRIAQRRSIEGEPLEALAQLLGEGSQDRADVSIVLSNALVRYAIVPHAERLSDRQERAALARARFTSIHGERAAQWEVRMAAKTRDEPGLAVAVDAALLEGVRAAVGRHRRLRLVSVQPYLMAAYNRARGDLPPAGGWLLLVERSRLCLALIESRSWRGVSVARAGDEDYIDMLERESARLAAKAPREVVAAGAPLADAGGWRFRSLPTGEPPYGLALSAL